MKTSPLLFSFMLCLLTLEKCEHRHGTTCNLHVLNLFAFVFHILEQFLDAAYDFASVSRFLFRNTFFNRCQSRARITSTVWSHCQPAPGLIITIRNFYRAFSERELP